MLRAELSSPPDSRAAALVATTPRGWHAELALGFERRGDKTVLARRRHDGPLVVQKPLYQEGPEICQTIIVHPPAGIAGGDTLAIDVEVATDARAMITTPGATKWYRSSGAQASQHITLRVAAAALLEWLPQETIVYRAALARSTIDIDLMAGARFIGWDIVCFGRTGSGERFSAGAWRARTRLRIGGRLVWTEQAAVTPDNRTLESPVAMGAQPITGTLLAVSADLASTAMTDLVATMRAIAPQRGIGGITRLPEVLVARYRGDSTEAARDYFFRIWELLRPSIAGRAASAPRIWRT